MTDDEVKQAKHQQFYQQYRDMMREMSSLETWELQTVLMLKLLHQMEAQTEALTSIAASLVQIANPPLSGTMRRGTFTEVDPALFGR